MSGYSINPNADREFHDRRTQYRYSVFEHKLVFDETRAYTPLQVTFGSTKKVWRKVIRSTLGKRLYPTEALWAMDALIVQGRSLILQDVFGNNLNGVNRASVFNISTFQQRPDPPIAALEQNLQNSQI